MFDVSFQELVLIAIVGLLVIGPKRLPEALRTGGLWIGRMRRSFNNVRTEIEKEIGMDEIRRQLHNEAVMEEMKRIERDVRDSVNSADPASSERLASSPVDEPAADEGATDRAAVGGSIPAQQAAPGTPEPLPAADSDPDHSPERPSAANDSRHG